MSASVRSTSERMYLWVSWLPAGSWIALDRYVDRYEGWGAWAAAPVLLVPIALSVLLLVPGAVLLWRARTAGRLGAGMVAAVVLASLPTLWLAWRFAVVSLR